MAKGAREKIKLKSTESSECYWTTKNKRTSTERIELKKFDKKLRKHVNFKEAKQLSLNDLALVRPVKARTVIRYLGVGNV